MAKASPDKANKAKTGNTKPVEKQLSAEIIQPPVQHSVKWWQNKKYINWLGYCLVLIPVVVYFNVINKYAVNLPYQDDYNAILEFLTKF